MPGRRGQLIVVDGTDGSGKTTQVALLVRRLRGAGRRAVTVDFPRYRSFFGRLLKPLLSGEFGDTAKLNPYLVSLAYALDRWQAAPRIRRALAAGTIVVANRYASSNLIHQGAKLPRSKRRAFVAWASELEFRLLKIPPPDLVVFLDVPPTVARQLILKRRQRTGKGDRADQDRRHQLYAYRMARWLSSQQPAWKQIACTERGRLSSPAVIHERVWQRVEPRLRR